MYTIQKTDDYLIDIYSGDTVLNTLSDTSIVIEVDNSSSAILTLESSVLQTINNLLIEKYNDYELVLTNTVYANLPDSIPMSIITGNLSVSRIDGLDDYLSTIPIDGGSP